MGCARIISANSTSSVVYESGAQPYFDILSVMDYGLGDSPQEDRRVGPERANFSRLLLVRELMEEYGDTLKPVWVSEYGWVSLPDDWQGDRATTWGVAVNEETQERWTIEGIERMRSEWPWVGSSSSGPSAGWSHRHRPGRRNWHATSRWSITSSGRARSIWHSRHGPRSKRSSPPGHCPRRIAASPGPGSGAIRRSAGAPIVWQRAKVKRRKSRSRGPRCACGAGRPERGAPLRDNRR